MLSRILAALTIVIGVTAISAQAQNLTPEEIQAAIEAGLKQRPEQIGVVMKESFGANLARSSVRGLFSNNSLNPLESGWEGFAITVHTPQTWIALAAAQAKSQFKPFTTADVTPEMLRPVLRVYAKPHAEVIVLRDTADKTVVVQPTAKGSYSNLVYFGRDGAVAGPSYFEFPLEAVRELQARNKDGEVIIQISVMGQVQDRNGSTTGGVTPMEDEYRLKKKHLKDLPGL